MADLRLTAPPSASGLLWQTIRNEAAKTAEEREKLLADPKFGVTFTDHMVDVCWSEAGGWHRPKVMPYGPISLDPAAAVFHYAQEVFEGLKAYRHADGSIWAFRPERNAARLQRSAARIALPELPTDIFLEAIANLIAVDGDWVPSAPETSLYLRPFLIAKEAFLGVRAAKKVGFYLIASPAGAYFQGGIKPLSIYLSSEYARAGRGGTGAAKFGGNYAASLLPMVRASEKGCQQVLFVDDTNTYLEELGGMNIVLVCKDGTLVTPDSPSILEGITRDSILDIASARGNKVEKRPVSIEEWRTGAKSGDIVGAFACGTAAVVTPIGRLVAEDFEIVHDGVDAAELALSLREELTDIQYGRRDDSRGWMVRLN